MLLRQHRLRVRLRLRRRAVLRRVQRLHLRLLRRLRTSARVDGSPKDGLAIGELAARAGVGADVIRYYERVGVLPRPARGAPGATHGGYRRYTAADVTRLAFVRRARALGFSLGEVRELLTLAGEPGRPCGEVDRLARAHLAQVEAKLAELAALRSELERLVAACDGGRAVADCDILCSLGAPAPASARR